MSARTVDGGLAFAARMHEDLVLVTLTGPLDTYTVPAFRRGVEPHAGADNQIVIDLSEVTLIDSAGLRALITLRNRSSQRDAPARRPLGLICPHRHLRRVFEITGLRRAFVFGSDLVAVRVGLTRGGGRTSMSPRRDESALARGSRGWPASRRRGGSASALMR